MLHCQNTLTGSQEDQSFYMEIPNVMLIGVYSLNIRLTPSFLLPHKTVSCLIFFSLLPVIRDRCCFFLLSLKDVPLTCSMHLLLICHGLLATLYEHLGQN